MSEFDLVIAGAGPVGCVVANKAATELGWKVMLVEKRNHIAGNCYDRYHESGVLIHQYGPHYFRTNNMEVYNFLSQYTQWHPGNYYVKSFTRGEYFPFPINIRTLEQFFNRSIPSDDVEAFLDSVREDISKPTNSEEFVLSRVGRELYEAFYLGYTKKQWDMHPKDLHQSVCGRIPVRFNKDERYVDHGLQIIPKDGYTRMFEKMVDHPNIHMMLQTDFKEIQHLITPKKATLFTGPVDEYFDHQLGVLPWRSLEFDFQTFHEEYRQPIVQINYPNDFLYTRSVEIKHVTRQKHPYTVISYEYPKAKGSPYYPIPKRENHELYHKYHELASNEEKNNIFFAGRLAEYTYINTDQAIERGFEIFNKIRDKNND